MTGRSDSPAGACSSRRSPERLDAGSSPDARRLGERPGCDGRDGSNWRPHAPFAAPHERSAVAGAERLAGAVGDAEDQQRRHEQRHDCRDRKHPPRSPAVGRTAVDRHDHRPCRDISDPLTPRASGAQHGDKARRVTRRQRIDEAQHRADGDRGRRLGRRPPTRRASRIGACRSSGRCALRNRSGTRPPRPTRATRGQLLRLATSAPRTPAGRRKSRGSRRSPLR